MIGRGIKRIYGWQAIALSLLVGGSAVAQGVPGGGSVAADETLKTAAGLSGPEQLNQAQGYLARMRSIQARVNRLLDTARKEKDVIKLNCVNEKLTEIKGNLNIADAAHRNLNEAVVRNDATGRTHEFSKILVIHQKVIVLGQEAEQCVGEDIRYTGTTSIITEVPPGLPDDPTYVEPPTPYIPRPIDASASL